MTITTEAHAPSPAAPAPTHRAGPTPKVTLPRVIRSEWIKLRSLRSTRITYAVAVIVTIGLGLLFAAATSGQLAGPDGDGPPIAADPTGITLSGVVLGQLIVGALGVMITAGEYSTGMIRSSLMAVPRRLPVLWAKALVFGVVTFALMLAASSVAFLGGQAVLSAGDAVTASLSDPGVLRAIVGSALQMTGVGLLGLALGALLRNTAAAISTLVAAVFLAPGIVGLLGATLGDAVGPYLPSTAAEAFRAIEPAANSLSAGAGLAVFAGYVVVVMAAAAVLLKRRDA